MWKKLRFSVVLATLALGGCLSTNDQGQYVDLSSYERGKVHFNAGQYGLAVKHFQSAVKRGPAFIEALNGLAASYDRLGRYDLSARYYGRALASNPDSVQTLNNIGYSYLLQKRFDLAVAYLRDAQSRDKDDPVVMANRETAEVSFQEADLKRSAAQAQAKSTASAPGTANARTDLAAALPVRPAASSRQRIEPWIERTAPTVQTLVTRPQVALLGVVEETGLNPQLAAYRPSQPEPGDLMPEPLSAPLGLGARQSRQSAPPVSPSAVTKRPARVGPTVDVPPAADVPPTADVPLSPDQPKTAPVVDLAPTEVTVANLDPLDNADLVVAEPEATITMAVSVPVGVVPVDVPVDVPVEVPVEVTVASLDPFHDMTDVGPRLGVRFDARGSVATIDRASPEASVVDFDPLDLLDDRTDEGMPVGRVEAAAPALEVVVANLGPLATPSAPAAVIEPTVSISVPLPLVELSNGTGRREMAARLRDYLEAQGVKVGRLTNADHYRHMETTIYYRKGWRAYAEDLARLLPAVIDLDGVEGQKSDVRLELGGDLLDFDRGIYYAGQRSNGEAVSLSARRGGARGFIVLATAMMMTLAGCATTPQTEPELETSILSAIEPAAPGTLKLAERALADGRYSDSRKLLERVLIGEPENIEAQLLAAELYLAAGATERAAAAFESLVESPEVGARAYQGRGISLMLLGERENGFESLRQAVERDSTLWLDWNALGYYHDVERDWAAAAESYGKALEGRPESALIYNNRGFSMLMQRRLEEAIDDFNRVLRIDSDFEVARENLRLALAWDGKYIHAMSGAAERDMPRILNNVGFIAMMRGDYANAEAYLLRAMEVDPSYNVAASRNLAYLKQVRELAKAESESTAD